MQIFFPGVKIKKGRKYFFSGKKTEKKFFLLWKMYTETHFFLLNC